MCHAGVVVFCYSNNIILLLPGLFDSLRGFLRVSFGKCGSRLVHLFFQWVTYKTIVCLFVVRLQKRELDSPQRSAIKEGPPIYIGHLGRKCLVFAKRLKGSLSPKIILPLMFLKSSAFAPK